MILKVSLVAFSAVLLYVILFARALSLATYHPLLILIALVLITEGKKKIYHDMFIYLKTKKAWQTF